MVVVEEQEKRINKLRQDATIYVDLFIVPRDGRGSSRKLYNTEIVTIFGFMVIITP